MALILKIGHEHCPDNQFHPKASGDWEGKFFTAPLPKTLDGDTVSIEKVPNGISVFIWTHNDHRSSKNSGQGLVAEGQLAEIKSDDELVEVKVERVTLFGHPIESKEAEQLKSQSLAIESLRRNSKTRALFLTESEGLEFRTAISSYIEEMSQKKRSSLKVKTRENQTKAFHNNRGWSKTELTDCLVAYFEMLRKELAGEKYSKAQINRNLREGSLKARSRGSIEYRMANITAFLEDKDLKTINGYKRRGNLGKNVSERLEAILKSLPVDELLNNEPIFDSDLVRYQASRLRGMFELVRPIGNEKPKKKDVRETRYARSEHVIAHVLDKADGHCCLCSKPAPFKNKDGFPFLEVHHVISLSEDGPDIVENAVALCPNCHKECHYSENKKALRHKLTKLLKNR